MISRGVYATGTAIIGSENEKIGFWSSHEIWLAQNLSSFAFGLRFCNVGPFPDVGSGPQESAINARINRQDAARLLLDSKATQPGSASGKKILVEHTSINPNKAAHIGHLRNAIL